MTTDTKISTAGLTATLREAIATMRADNARALARMIEEDEAAQIARAVRAILRKRGDEHVHATLVVRGGYVPNSYGYSAQSDEVRVSVDLTAGVTTVIAERTHAQSRRNGCGPCMVGRLVRADQTVGTIVYNH